MKIKILWGFEGDALKLGLASGRVRAGEEIEGVDDEYAHTMIGKGLAKQVIEEDAAAEAKAVADAAREAEAKAADEAAAEAKATAIPADAAEADAKAAAEKNKKQTGPKENK